MNIYKSMLQAMCPTLAAVCASGAVAQAMEEVIVTSQLRDQSLQDVSVAVTVIDSQILDDFGVDRIGALADFTPGMTINTSPGNFTGPSIRGIGTNSGVQTFEQSVGMFVDGVYSGRFRQYQASVFDVERVEVVKGGQGTLYGRNSSVGVVSLTTRTPGTEFGGYVTAEYETEFQTNVITGAMDLPISESFRVRLAGKYLDDPGYVKNTATGADNPDRQEQALRLTAVWDASDDLEAIFRYTRADFEISGAADEITADPGFLPGLTLSGDVDANPAAEGRPNHVRSASSLFFEEEDKQDTTDLSLTLNWSIGDHVLTSITASSELDMSNFYDSDSVSGIPNFGFPAFTTAFEEDFEQFTQELRLTSPAGNQLEYLVGMFYIDQEYDFDQAVYAFDTIVPTFANAVSQEMFTWSVFGQATWNFNDSTRVTGSLRYTDEEKDGEIFFPGLLVGNSDTLVDESVDWSITLAKDFGDNMIYATGSASTKSGGIPNNLAALENMYLPAEEVLSFEVGLKMLLERGYVNIAAYNMDLTDYQSSFFNGAVFVADSLDGSSQGIEIDGQWQLSDTIGLRGTAAHNKMDSDDPDLGFTRAPEWTASLGADYDTSIGSAFGFRGSLWAVYSDEYWHQPTFAPGLNAEANTMVHARAAVVHQSSGVEVAIFAANLTNEKVQEFAFPAFIPGVVGGAPGTVIAPLTRPRTIALQLNIPF